MSESATALKSVKAKEPSRPAHELAGAISAIMGEIQEGLAKRGYNQHFGYSFATVEDLLDLLRPLFAKHGVAFLPTIEEVKTEGKLTLIKCQMNLIHGPSGAGLTAQWYGQAQDTGDKGINKALTSAVKYFLLRCFCISAGNEPDSDADDAEGKPAVAEKAYCTPDQLATMRSHVELAGKEWADFVKYVKSKTGGSGPEDLLSVDAEDWIRYLKDKLPKTNGGATNGQRE